MRKSKFHIVWFVFVLSLFLPVSTTNAGNLNLGTLVCSKSGHGVSFIIYSFEDVECTYHGAGGPQNYAGKSGILLGLDLEGRVHDLMVYTVMGGAWSSADQMAGFYTGVKVSASVIVGGAVQVGLVSVGSGISLVPLSMGVGTGLGAKAGLGYLALSLAEPGSTSTIPLPDSLKTASPAKGTPQDEEKKELVAKIEKVVPTMEQAPVVKTAVLEPVPNVSVKSEKRGSIVNAATEPRKAVSKERYFQEMKDTSKPLSDDVIRAWNNGRKGA